MTTPDHKTWQTLRFRIQQAGETDHPHANSNKGDHWDHGETPLAPLEDALFEAGAVSVTLLDAEDHPIHEPDPGAQPLWPSVVVEALFESDVTLAEIVRRLVSEGWLDADTPIDIEGLPDQVWTRAWMDRFVPMSFGEHLWICPSHIEPDPSWPVVIRLDPGLAFGSGTHPTTALCLRWLDQRLGGMRSSKDTTQPPLEVIDFGCGSGILGIAAAILGADRVISVDHDPQALVATEQNAIANGCRNKLEILSPEDFFANAHQRPTRVVMANILAKPLIDLAPKLMALVAEDGYLVLSGILEAQAPSVIEAYQDLDPQPKVWIEEDWVCLGFAQKRSSHYN